MKHLILFITLVLLSAYFYIKRVSKSFKIKLYELENLSVIDKRLKGFILLKIENNKLPNIDITDVSLDVSLNNVFLSKIKNTEIIPNGFVKLHFNIDLKNIIKIRNILSFLKGRKITIYGSVEVEKKPLKTTLPVNESFSL